MRCPKCGEEMSSGYIQNRDGIFWTPKKQLVAALSGFGKGAVRLENDESRSAVRAYNCGRCEIVLIPYGEPENQEETNE